MKTRRAQKTPAPVPADIAVPDRFVDWLATDQSLPDQARKGDRTRFALKAAAAALLEEKGYESFSTGDVSDRAGVTRTAFYAYFPSKRALVLDLLDDFHRFMKGTLQPGQRPADPRNAVRETNRTYVRFFAANARIILSIQHVRRTLSGADRQHFDLNDWWARKIASAIVRRGGTGSAARSRRALATAYALEAMIDGFLTELYVRRNPNLVALDLTEDEVADFLSDAWIGASG